MKKNSIVKTESGGSYMKKLMLIFVLCTVYSVFARVGVTFAENSGIGIRAGMGTDITGGIAYGIGVNRLISNDLEVGAVLFRAHVEETTKEIHTYTETTDVTVFGVLANLLGNYRLNQSGVYYLAGVGLGVFNVNWEEKSPTDTTLGTKLSGGGSKQSAEGTAAGSILNLGLGMNFKNNFDIRAEIPMFFIFSAPGQAAPFIPTFTATVGYRF